MTKLHKGDYRMRVYQLNNENTKFSYPEEMKRILEYLSEHGTIYVSDETIERLYRKFSRDMYSASWMGISADDAEDTELLEEFASWLDSFTL